MAGCSESSITGLGDRFEARVAADLVEIAVRPEYGSLSTGHVGLVVQAVKNAPAVSLIPGLDGRLESFGGSDETPLLGKMRRALGPTFSVAGRDGILPDGVLGKTFVLGSTAGGYGIDEDAGGPVDGARFHMYELDPVTGRPKLIPPSLAGHLDLREPIPNAGLDVDARNRNGDVLANMTMARDRVENGSTSASTFTSSGDLGPLTFSMRDHVAFSDGFTRADFAFERDLDSSEGVSVVYSASGYVSSSESGQGHVRIVTTIESGGHTVTLDILDDGFDVSGTVTYDGQLAVTISGNAIDPTFSRPDSTPLDGGALDDMWHLWVTVDLALYFGDELLLPLSTLIN
jgi:hypothetical protein